jgi:ribosomal-protein-alanine N-acetyltransferase
MKRESGVRLTPVEVRRLAVMLGLEFPSVRQSSKLSSAKKTGGRDPIEVHIRWMIRRDMVGVLEIEKQSFDYPWTEDEFIRVLRCRYHIGMVAEHEGCVVGFMVYALHKHRLELLNIAVDDRWRRASIGKQFIEKLASKLSVNRRTRIVIDVRETNLTAQLFLSSTGLLATQVIDDYYDGFSESAIRFEYKHYEGKGDE